MALPEPLQHALDHGIERLERTADEVANALTHGLGLALSIVGGVFLVLLALARGSGVHVGASVVFAATLVLLYAASTCYHAACRVRLKNRLRTLDHIAILYLIAGTYTPLALAGLGGPWGWTMLTAVWVLALTGTVYKLVAPVHFERGSLWLYVAMGWVVVLFTPLLVKAVSWTVLACLAAGGLLYMAGVYFYARERWRFDHAAWHLFVLGGSGFHFAAAVLLVR